MLQIIIAVAIIAWFLLRLIIQKRRHKISKNEFVFWLFFWLLVLAAVLSLKRLDALAADLGFSVPAIQVLTYLAVAALFYFIFRIRLRLEKTEESLTKLVEILAKMKK